MLSYFATIFSFFIMKTRVSEECYKYRVPTTYANSQYYAEFQWIHMLIQWIHMLIHNNMQNFSRYIHYIGYYGVNAKPLLKILQDEICKH